MAALRFSEALRPKALTLDFYVRHEHDVTNGLENTTNYCLHNLLHVATKLRSYLVSSWECFRLCFACSCGH